MHSRFRDECQYRLCRSYIDISSKMLARLVDLQKGRVGRVAGTAKSVNTKQTFSRRQPSPFSRHYGTMTLEEAKKLPRESDDTDVLIVGGGPAGLSAAIRLKQLCNETGKDIRVTLLEKGENVGMLFSLK
jgi:NADPH-dependent 2,4-dienoyl-CoA reductase/sulfur reductase-like enzyme